jgi:hypothetical protein
MGEGRSKENDGPLKRQPMPLFLGNYRITNRQFFRVPSSFPHPAPQSPHHPRSQASQRTLCSTGFSRNQEARFAQTTPISPLLPSVPQSSRLELMCPFVSSPQPLSTPSRTPVPPRGSLPPFPASPACLSHAETTPPPARASPPNSVASKSPPAADSDVPSVPRSP